MTCVVARERGCGRGEQTIWKRHRVCVGEGCESERERELVTERERGREGAFVSINGV